MKKLLILALLIGGSSVAVVEACPKGQVRHCFNLKAPAMGRFCGCAKQKRAIKALQLEPVSIVQDGRHTFLR